MTVLNIIEKYEVPKEYHDALWEAYQEGAKRGFIDATLPTLKEPVKTNGRTTSLKAGEEKYFNNKEVPNERSKLRPLQSI